MVALAVERLEGRDVPTVSYGNGPLLSNVEVQSYYYGDQWQNNPGLFAQTGQLEDFLNYVVNSPFTDMLTRAGYGVGAGTADPGVIRPVNLDPAFHLDEQTILTSLQSEIDAGFLKAPDANRYYIVFVEPNVVVHSSIGDSTSDFLAIHNSSSGHDAAGNPATIRYAVLPYPGVATGNQYYVGPPVLDSLTATASHELAEGMTDPDPTSGWYDAAHQSDGGEIADIANNVQYRINGYAVAGVVDQNDNNIFPAELTATGQSLNLKTGQAFSGKVAVGHDATRLTQGANLQATIAWGDGSTSLGTVADDGQGNYAVTGAHTYQFAHSYTISVSLQDKTNSIGTAVATTTALVANAHPTALQAVSAAYDRLGRQYLEVVYGSGAWYQYDYTGAHYQGSGLQSVSVAFDGAGHEVLQVVNASGAWYQYDAAGAHYQGSGVQSVSMTYDMAGAKILQVVNGSSAWYQYDDAGAHYQGSGVQSVSEAFNRNGYQVIQVVNASGAWYQYDPSGAHFNTSNVQSVSMTYDGLGQAVVEVVFSSGAWYQIDSSGSHHQGG
jgi:hypothetical protein